MTRRALAAPKGNGYGGMTNDGMFQMAFPTSGTYKYHCMFHGSITVQ